MHLDRAEHRAFWAWTTVEFLRHTGARVEEMLETAHHAMIQYRLPTTGEVVPLLQVAPSCSSSTTAAANPEETPVTAPPWRCTIRERQEVAIGRDFVLVGFSQSAEKCWTGRVESQVSKRAPPRTRG
ncbi:hypothetical protein WKI68_37285 [Streptomyces sp. MS1.HAVA.3]|uniref:Integrase n=1 Tax=Streptomyces caledonius TaxID=3134107 RepID=A0ABU8UBR8_9ACTN